MRSSLKHGQKIINRDIRYNKSFNGDPFAGFAAQMRRNDDGPVSAQVEKVISRMYRLFESHLGKAIQAKQLPADSDVKLLARRTIHVYQGALIMAKITSDLEYIKDLNALILIVLGLKK